VAMEKSMQALEQVNWKSLEMTLKAQGMKVNVEQIHREIEKALVQIDWKKLNEETGNALDEANNEVQKLQDEFVVKIGNYQRNRTVQQERLKQAQQQILMDRLQQREQIRKMEQDKKKECAKPVSRKKKIVQI
jgi:pyrrolidone-carboxylate peptidase